MYHIPPEKLIGSKDLEALQKEQEIFLKQKIQQMKKGKKKTTKRKKRKKPKKAKKTRGGKKLTRGKK